MIETTEVSSKKIFPLCNVKVNFSKCQILVVFEQFCNFFHECPFFLHYRQCKTFPKFSGGFVAELGGKRHVNSAGIPCTM